MGELDKMNGVMESHSLPKSCRCIASLSVELIAMVDSSRGVGSYYPGEFASFSSHVFDLPLGDVPILPSSHLPLCANIGQTSSGHLGALSERATTDQQQGLPVLCFMLVALD